jgi:lycopene cyclase domain-containing protein
MTAYTTYNLALATLVLPISYGLTLFGNQRRDLLVSARVALLVTLLGYPWDFFAIHSGVWTYPKYPGIRVYDVPLNDLIFMWLCSHFTCALLIAVRRRYSGGDRQPKSKDAGE